VGLANLAQRATLFTTGPDDFPSYDATEDQKKEWDQKRKDRRAQEERDRADALAELRKWAESREADAYLRGVDETLEAEGRSRYNTRSIALILVLVVLVAMPIIAIASNIDPERFGSYIAPVTGIAGTVVGYWFTSAGRSERPSRS
jgi:hypothetical protein